MFSFAHHIQSLDTCLFCYTLTEGFVGLTAGVLEVSCELYVGKSCCGIESLSVYKENLYYAQ